MPNIPDIPFPLVPGDTIGIAAPASCFDQDLFQKGLDALKGQGYKVVVPGKVFQRNGYLAGEDQARAEMFTQLWTDSGIKAVLCARGGYGALRILPLLDFDLLSAHKKILVGFSDITCLLSTMAKACQIPVFHGPVLTSLGRHPEQTRSLIQCLTGNLPRIWLPQSVHVLVQGTAEGLLTGGNLTTLCHLAGTPFQPDFSNKVLFLEDVGEAPYRIDRMLTHLRLCGMLDGVKGVILGSFHDCGEEMETRRVLGDCLKPMKIPVMGGFPAGHGREHQGFPMNVPVRMDTAQASLEFLLS